VEEMMKERMAWLYKMYRMMIRGNVKKDHFKVWKRSEIIFFFFPL